MESIVGIVIAIILTGLIVPGISITRTRLNSDMDYYYNQNIETDKVVEGINNIEIENIVEALSQLSEIESDENVEDYKEITEEMVLKYLKESLEECTIFSGKDNQNELKDKKVQNYLKEIEAIEVFIEDEIDESKKILPLILYREKIFNIIISKEYIKVNELVRSYDLEKTEQKSYKKKDYTSTENTDEHSAQIGIKNIRYIRR